LKQAINGTNKGGHSKDVEEYLRTLEEWYLGINLNRRLDEFKAFNLLLQEVS